MIPRLWQRIRRLWWRVAGAPEPEIHGGIPPGGDPDLGARPYDPRFPAS